MGAVMSKNGELGNGGENGDADAHGSSANRYFLDSPQPLPIELTHYKMDHSKRGLAVIFNHVFFTVDGLPERHSSSVDCARLQETLTNLGFVIQVYENLISTDIRKVLEKVAGMDHTDHDCLVVTILTHGDVGILYGLDGPYGADTICSYFTDNKCPSLAGKPKIFFVQACQGKESDRGFTFGHRRIRAVGESTEADVSQFLKPNYEDAQEQKSTMRIITDPDMLIAYPSIPEYASYRFVLSGSPFIKTLCEELDKNGTETDILGILTSVSMHVAIDFESNDDNPNARRKKQILCVTSTLRRVLQFTPRLVLENPKTSSDWNAILVLTIIFLGILITKFI